MKYKYAVAVALAALAQPTFAQGNRFSVPSNQAEARFAGDTTDNVGGKIANRCMDRAWTVTMQNSNQVVCEFKLDMASMVIARVFLGNRYSTPPRGFMRFAMAQVGSDVRVQAYTWIETEMAFGQMRQEAQTGPDYFDGMISMLLDAGGTLPEGSRVLGRYLGLFGKIEGGKPCCGYRILRVASGTPAHAAGLKAGDVIIRINGKKFKNDAEFLSRFRNIPLGTAYPVVFTRNGAEQEVKVISSEWPAVGSEEFRKVSAELSGETISESPKP